ncbi:MAG: class I SAM-dependent methyltransferase, partial [Actinomycetota bacterium]
MPNPGVERRTIEVYETGATAWAAERDVQDTEAVRWVDEARAGRPVVDLGTGPGWQLADVAAPAIALDAAAGMLALVPDHAPHALRVRALVEDLPLRPGSLGGAVSNRVHLHLSTAAVPMALADLHRSLGDGARVFLRLLANDRFDEVRQLDGPFAGRGKKLIEVIRGASVRNEDACVLGTASQIAGILARNI